MTVLIIDDDLEDREILRDAIGEVDPSIKCLEAADGEAGLFLLAINRKSFPDFIFLDINMPLMTGKACLKILKKSTLLKSIPVVMYSTTSDGQEMRQYLASGAFRFITKPGKFGELKASLRSLFGVPADH